MKEIEMLHKLGCIERCEATWVMPVIMVKKKDTIDLRMCIDFRSLNKDMIVENYPILRIDYILNKLYLIVVDHFFIRIKNVLE